MYRRSQPYQSTDFYAQQQKLGRQLADESYQKSAPALEERKKEIKRQYDEKVAYINAENARIREYERKHGNSGNFFKDFAYGFKKGLGYTSAILKPFNKYVAPVISMAGPVGSAIAGATTAASGVIDKL